MFSALGGWWGKELEVWDASKGLWDKDYLSQSCQAAEPKDALSTGKGTAPPAGCVQPWAFPLIPLIALMLAAFKGSINLGMNNCLSMAGDSTSLLLWRIMKSLRSVPITYTTELSELLVTDGKNNLLSLWSPANLTHHTCMVRRYW